MYLDRETSEKLRCCVCGKFSNYNLVCTFNNEFHFSSEYCFVRCLSCYKEKNLYFKDKNTPVKAITTFQEIGSIISKI